MRIARKFTLALVACVIAALSLNAVFAVRDEIERFEQEVSSKHIIIGRALRPALVSVWAFDGRDRALALVREADQRLRRVEIRWVWLDADGGDTFAPHVPKGRLDAVRRGEELSVVNAGLMVSYVPLTPPEVGSQAGAIEISQTLDRENEVRLAAVRQAIFLVVGVSLLSAVVASLLGVAFVGRPMSGFIEQARRIGRGDLSYRITVRQRDEFDALADEMNRMCESLVESQDSARRATDAKLRAIDQLRHADRLATVGRLAAGMAHELGTPLNVVSARAKPIAQGKVEGETARDHARIIVEQVDRIAKIMRQLLDFARKRELAKTRADLSGAVRRVVTFVEPIAKKADVRVDVDASDEPAIAEVDPGQMDQVVTNLVINAVHASARGDVVLVSVARELVTPPDGDAAAPIPCVVIRVRDHGVGVPPEHLPQIFEPFFTTKEVGEGTGLGLSVAYGIVKDHGGFLQVESEVGKGSCFAVCLPVPREPTVAGPEIEARA